MNVLDDPNGYKKLYENLDKFFSDQQNTNSQNVQDVQNNKLANINISTDLADYKKLANTRIEKMYKLFEINVNNNKNDKELIDKIKTELNDYKSLNDGRVDKLAKLFVLLNKKS